MTFKLQNTVYDNPNYYSSVDKLHCANGHTTEPLPYLDPLKTIGRVTNEDYEVMPKLDNYEQPQLSGMFNDLQYEAVDYLLPTIDNNIYEMSSNTLPAGEELPEDEEIYEDPGHVKEEIYEWFKQRNICKLDKNSVR